MKNIVFALFVIFAFALPYQIMSQTSVGIFGGVNLQKLSGDAPFDGSYAGSMGYLFGVSGETRIMKDIKLVLQPNYTKTGSSIEIDIGEEEPVDSFTVETSFYRIPVLAKIEALNGVTYFMSGLDFGILSSAVLKSTNDASKERDIYDNINQFDLAALFGVGAKIKLSSKLNLIFEGRYAQSLLNQSKENSGEAFDYIPARFRQAGFQFLSYITFNL